MKKYLLITLLFFSVGEVFAEDKIAVVDLQQLVSNSSQVKQLKQEHSKKLAELDKIIVNARGEIANEKDQAKILLLEDKYMKEFNTKKDALERDYNNRLSAIEKNIKTEISYNEDNELGQVAHSMRSSMGILELYIKDIDDSTEKMSQGNFDIDLSQ